MNDVAHGLSVVMIMKDAERYLSLVLRSLMKVADEIIVVDTGSTDRSREIARSYGCRLFEFAWCDDFSKAKNHGIDQARFSWILSVDADEVLYDSKSGVLLKEALLDDNVPAYVIWVDSIYDSGRIDQVRMLRLFRNTPQIRFINPVHESIGEPLYAGWPGFVPPVLDLHLRHYGYLSPNARGKHERNIVLLNKWAEAAPDNIYANYKLGGTLVESGRRHEALPYLERVFRLFDMSAERGTYPFMGTFITLYKDLLVAEGRMEEAERFSRVAGGW